MVASAVATDRIVTAGSPSPSAMVTAAPAMAGTVSVGAGPGRTRSRSPVSVGDGIHVLYLLTLFAVASIEESDMDEGLRYADNGDIRIAYERFGDLQRGEPLLLIMGLDFQMVWWPEKLIDRLVALGFAVVLSDNRDTGLSTHYQPVDRPNPW